MDMFEKLQLLIKFLFLGLFQGFTEPIPISSSGHLILIRELFHLEVTSLSFEIIVHFGSLIAITYVYRKEINSLIINTLKYVFKRKNTLKSDFLFVTYLLFATFITGIIGLMFEDMISNHLTKPFFIGLALLFTSVFLWIIRHKKGHRSELNLTFRDAFLIGLFQSLALIPGISRSGTTVVTALLLGLKRKTALKFSFLLFIPVSLGITILSIKDIFHELQTNELIIPYILAFLVAIIATYFALKWFIHIMQTGKLHIFAFYCFIIGLAVIIFM